MLFQRHTPIIVQRRKSSKNGFLPIKVPLLLFSIIFSSILALAFLLLSGHSNAIGHGFDENWKREEDGKRRLRRQMLPLDNIRIYATNSNVSVTDRVQVLSSQSRIQLLESHLNATIWSNASLLQMLPNGEEVVLSASQAIGLTLAMFGGARMEGTGESLQLNESSQLEGTATDWHSRMEAELAGKLVNLSWLDAQGAIALRAIGARMAALVSLGWERPGKAEELSILSAASAGGSGENGTTEERELSIVADSSAYQVQIRLIGAETALQFLGARLDIPAPHRSLLIRWQGWQVQVQSLESPLEVRASANELRIICYNEALSIRLATNSIGLDVDKLSRLMVNRSASPASTFPTNIRINGGQISSSSQNSSAGSMVVDLAELISRELHLSLSRDPQLGQSVLADSRNSQLKLTHSNRTSIFTAIRHFVEMLGREPVLELLAGNVSVKMSAVESNGDGGDPPLETEILPPELMASNDEDIFGIGPIATWPTTTMPSSSGLLPISTQFPPIVRPIPSTSTTPPPSTSTSTTTTTLSSSPIPMQITPLMARPNELFTFRQSFPPTTQSATTIPAEQNVDDGFPSPQAHIFTLPPPDSDFLVGQFETAAALSGGGLTSAPFPISATISSLQIPREEEGQAATNMANDFPGIRRENRGGGQFIWRPEEMLEAAERPTVEKGLKETRKTRQLRMEMEKEGGNDGNDELREEATIEMIIDIGPVGNLLRDGRLRDELARGMEEWLGEGNLNWQQKIGVTKIKLEEALKANAIRAKFWLKPMGMERAEMLEKLRQNNGLVDGWRDRQLAGHKMLSGPHLLLSSPSTSTILPPNNKNLPVARSPAILAISVHSLPVLPIGFLALSLSLLAMIFGLRPLAKAILKLKKLARRRKIGRREGGDECRNI